MPRTRSATATTRSFGPLPTLERPTTSSSSARDSPVLASAYRWHKERPDDSVLIFDVHPIFGGEAKQNEFEVDGVRLWGPQGSNGNVYPIKKAIETGFGAPLWRELGLPEEFVWQEPKGLEKEMRIPPDVYGPMHITWESADQGFYYENKGFVINPWANRFKDAPIPEQLKQDMIWMETFRQPPRREDWAKWLDSMTYQQFITDVMGIKSDVASYLNPQMAAMGCGLGTDVASAYSAYRFLQPGVNAYDRYLGVGDVTDQVWLASWPGGNTGQLRYLVKNIIPGAFAGGTGLSEVLFGPVQWQNLDRANEPVRMRLSSLVVDIRHDGAPESAETVLVTYLKDGRLRRVTAKRVIVAGQQHLNKRIVADLPAPLKTAMDAFMHAPICTVNVALRNWKFLEKLGISAVALVRRLRLVLQPAPPDDHRRPGADAARPGEAGRHHHVQLVLPAGPAGRTAGGRRADGAVRHVLQGHRARSPQPVHQDVRLGGIRRGARHRRYHGESLGPCLRREPAVLRVWPGRPAGAARCGARGLWPAALRAFRARRRADVGNGSRRGRARGQATDGGCVR